MKYHDTFIAHNLNRVDTDMSCNFCVRTSEFVWSVPEGDQVFLSCSDHVPERKYDYLHRQTKTTRSNKK